MNLGLLGKREREKKKKRIESIQHILQLCGPASLKESLASLALTQDHLHPRRVQLIGEYKALHLGLREGSIFIKVIISMATAIFTTAIIESNCEEDTGHLLQQQRPHMQL